jgi:hemin uptake protein HemP
VNGNRPECDPPAGREAPTAGPGLRIASTELFQGRREIVIVHRGQEYRLHITRADKLILTK